MTSPDTHILPWYGFGRRGDAVWDETSATDFSRWSFVTLVKTNTPLVAALGSRLSTPARRGEVTVGEDRWEIGRADIQRRKRLRAIDGSGLRLAIVLRPPRWSGQSNALRRVTCAFRKFHPAWIVGRIGPIKPFPTGDSADRIRFAPNDLAEPFMSPRERPAVALIGMQGEGLFSVGKERKRQPMVGAAGRDGVKARLHKWS